MVYGLCLDLFWKKFANYTLNAKNIPNNLVTQNVGFFEKEGDIYTFPVSLNDHS